MTTAQTVTIAGIQVAICDPRHVLDRLPSKRRAKDLARGHLCRPTPTARRTRQAGPGRHRQARCPLAGDPLAVNGS